MRQSRTLRPATEPLGSVDQTSGSRPLRVLVVGVSWPMETFVERLVTGLAVAGTQVTLATMGLPARPPAEWLAQHGITWSNHAANWQLRGIIRSAGRRSGSIRVVVPSPSDAFRRGGRRRRELTERGWDVIYAPWVSTLIDHPDLLDVPVPLVTSCRGTLVTIAPLDPSRRGHSEALARIFTRATAVHCVSDAIVADAAELGLSRTKAVVIRPAVDPTVFTPRRCRRRADGAVRVMSTGGLTWVKDYESAIGAVHRARALGVDVELDIIGEGPDRQHLEFVIDDLGLAGRVRLLGRLSADRVARTLGEADVFLHTSSSEGISNAVLEAMASGVAVITTDAGGMTEAVRDGVDGIVVPVRDPDAAARALFALASEPELRERLGRAGRERVLDSFRLDQQIEAFTDLLHEAAQR